MAVNLDAPELDFPVNQGAVVAIDFDGTITKHPAGFKKLIEKIRAAGGTAHLLTARPETERQAVLTWLSSYGIVLDGYHFYPETYTKQLVEKDREAYVAKWIAFKSAALAEMGATDLIDDTIDYEPYMREHNKGTKFHLATTEAPVQPWTDLPMKKDKPKPTAEEEEAAEAAASRQVSEDLAAERAEPDYPRGVEKWVKYLPKKDNSLKVIAQDNAVLIEQPVYIDQMVISFEDKFFDYYLRAPGQPDGHYVVEIGDQKVGFGSKYQLRKFLKTIQEERLTEGVIPALTMKVRPIPTISEPVVRRLGAIESRPLIRVCAVCTPHHLLGTVGDVPKDLFDKTMAEQSATGKVSDELRKELETAGVGLTHGVCEVAEKKILEEMEAKRLAGGVVDHNKGDKKLPFGEQPSNLVVPTVGDDAHAVVNGKPTGPMV